VIHRVSNDCFFGFFLKTKLRPWNQRSLPFIVLIGGVFGGLCIVLLILLLCKYCLNRRNARLENALMADRSLSSSCSSIDQFREAEQIRLLYEKISQSTPSDGRIMGGTHPQPLLNLEPRRSRNFYPNPSIKFVKCH
jgi:hypothetical protein